MWKEDIRCDGCCRAKHSPFFAVAFPAFGAWMLLLVGLVSRRRSSVP